MSKCYDCHKKITKGGVTVGRMSCPSIWTTICDKCDSDYKKTDGHKKVNRLLKSLTKQNKMNTDKEILEE